VAVKADTGEYVWHYQTGTENVHNENNQIMMADLLINGEKRHVALTAPKNGFFYILDAKTGKLLSAKPLVKTTWASAYDLQSAKPVLIPTSQGGGRQWTVHNWWPMSYSSLTGPRLYSLNGSPGRKQRPPWRLAKAAKGSSAG